MKKKEGFQPLVKLINTHQAKSQLSKLVREVEELGTLVKICRNGKPVVELRRLSAASTRTDPNPILSKVVFYENPIASTDDDAWPEDQR